MYIEINSVFISMFPVEILTRKTIAFVIYFLYIDFL